MQKQGLWKSISVFETGLSAAEWGWRIATLLFIGGSGTISALVAKTDPLFKELGAIYWITVGAIISLIATFIFYLIKSAYLKQTIADYHRTMATPKNTINPLAESFRDLIIPVEDLRLPTVQLHVNKHFKRCKFVGPGTLAILGGSYFNSNFNDCGDIVALPLDTSSTGIIGLQNCTVEECEFIKVSIFVDQGTGKGFSSVGGATIKGLLP